MSNKQNDQPSQLPCPECDSPLQIPAILKVNQILECQVCGCENEVLSLKPVKISPLEEEK